jgi:hypothetical protein
MRKRAITLIVCFIAAASFGQTSRKLSTYLSAQFNQTLYDRTTGNNPWGMGLGLQAYFNNKTNFKPTMEVTADTYLQDDKVQRLTPGGEPIDDVGGVVNLFAGVSYHPTQKMYVSFLLGPSFINGNTSFGIKPSLGFYFSGNQKWTCKISYINVFNREPMSGQDFGSISLAIGLKLF